jgi:hypothetical protein
VVAVDYLQDNFLVLTESDESPNQHILFLSRDGRNWVASELQIRGRVTGAKLLGHYEAVICTSKSLYLWRSS